MTCAACAARVEKNLNAIDGVLATVNFATERATVPGMRWPSWPRRLERAGVPVGGTEPVEAEKQVA
jgi:Cu+-exporting ATPase